MLKIKQRLRYYKNKPERDKSFVIGINIGPNKNKGGRISLHKKNGSKAFYTNQLEESLLMTFWHSRKKFIGLREFAIWLLLSS